MVKLSARDVTKCRAFDFVTRHIGSMGAAVHPMLTVTHNSYSCHEVLEKKSADSSPSHSQMSRNSSKKSSNSALVVNSEKKEGEKEVIRERKLKFSRRGSRLVGL